MRDENASCLVDALALRLVVRAMTYRLSKTTAPLSTRVPLEQARSLQRLAARRGMTTSDVIAVLVAREFGDNADQPTPTPPFTTTTDLTERSASASEPTAAP